MSANAPQAEHTTEMAVSERHKLRKSLTYFDMVFFTVCAIVGLDILGQVSGYGAQTFTWIVVLIIFFLAPYALLMVELGSTFTQEGGPYEWMKLSWGRLVAGIGAVLYWVTNPFWVGGSLCFTATDAWSANLHPIDGSPAYQPVRRTSSSWSTKKSALSRVMQSGGLTFSMFRWSPVGWTTTPRSRRRSQIASATSVAGSRFSRLRTSSTLA
jgi:amino acid transporter